MSLKERPVCPKCKKGTGVRHCTKSKYCNWYICTKCGRGPGMDIIFDTNNNYFSYGGMYGGPGK